MSKRASISNCNLHGGQPEVNFSDAFSDVILNFDREAAFQAELEVEIERAIEKMNNLRGGQEPTVVEEELQLHSDEATPKSGHRRNYYNATVKLDAINYAREKSSAKSGNKLNIASAAKKYKVTRSRIYEWIGQETKLKQQVLQPVRSQLQQTAQEMGKLLALNPRDPSAQRESTSSEIFELNKRRT